MKTLFYLAVVILMTLKTEAQTFTLNSNDVGGQVTSKHIFNGFGCTGKNLSPQLFWENTPKATKSFAVTMYDPDAPTGSGWWHWVAFDIPSSITNLKSGAGDISKALIPKQAIQSRTDFGSYGYGGPCPPEGDGFHRYMITVYALNVDKLGLDKDASPALVGFYLNSKTIEKASIIMYLKR